MSDQPRAVLLRGARRGLGGPPCDLLLGDGRITALAPAGQLRPEPGVELIRLGDATVLPGLVDGHVHVDQLAHHSRRVDVSGADSPHAVVDRLVGRAPGAGVLVGHGFVDGLWAEPPHKEELDRRLPGVPVVVISADLHAAWASSVALERFGLDHPTGLLREQPAMDVIAHLQNAVPAAEVDRWVADVLAAMAARGVTRLVDFEYADTLASWLRRATPPLRVWAAVWPEWLDAAIAAGRRTGDVVPGTDGMVRIGPLKVVADGSLNTRTAWCDAPYAGDSGPDAHGLALVQRSELVRLMRTAWAAGLEPAVHAIGDRANAAVLDAFEEVGCPGRIEHAQLVRAADLRRFARPWLIASVQPQHATADRDVADRHWAGRTDRAFPYRSLYDAGARLELGSDAPVSPPDPWRAIADAVERTDDDRPPWHPEQALPLAAAVTAACGGRADLAVGQPADLTVAAGDLATVAAVRSADVVLTMVGGVVTHRLAA